MKPTVIFFGNERLSSGLAAIKPRVLQALIDQGYPVAAVVVNQEAGKQGARVLEVQELAEQHGIPVLAPQKPLDILDQLAGYQPSIGVLVAYGRIVPQSVIDLFPQGILNLHPSLLPVYRGSTPIEQAILDGVDMTGVSIMQLTPQMDAGPLYIQEPLKVSKHEQKAVLADRLLELGTQLLMACLKQETIDSNKLIVQNENLASYTSQITKSDGLIDWAKPAAQIERQIRAYLGWPGSYTKLADKDVIITAAHIEKIPGKPGSPFTDNNRLGIFCGQDALIIDRLKPAGKREMTGREFLAGNRI